MLATVLSSHVDFRLFQEQKSISLFTPFNFHTHKKTNKQDFKIRPGSTSQTFWSKPEWKDIQEGEKLEFGKDKTNISPFLVRKGFISLSLEVLFRHW